MSVKEIREKINNRAKKVVLSAAIMASLGGSAAMAQTQKSDSIKQNKVEMTADEQGIYKAFENMYSNALYMKYRTDAGIFGNKPTPKDMVKEIKAKSGEYAGNIIEMKKNKTKGVKETHNKQMSGVSIENGNVYSYAYEKDGQRRIAQGELTGSATNFLELEQEEAGFNKLFDNAQKNLDR